MSTPDLHHPGIRRLIDGVESLADSGGRLIPVFILLGLWELASGTIISPNLLPPFSDVIPEIVTLYTSETSKLRPYMMDTIFRGFAGIFIATLIGVPVGLAMARSEFVNRQLDPVVSIMYPSPKSPLIPLVIFWLGIGHSSRIALAVVGGFLPIILSSVNGANNIDEELIWSARSMGLSRREEILKVVLPASLPTVLTGIRIGLIASFIIVIQSEMIIARTGIGVLIINFGEYGQYAKVFAAVFYAVLLVGLTDRLYLKVSNYLLRWSEQDVRGI